MDYLRGYLEIIKSCLGDTFKVKSRLRRRDYILYVLTINVYNAAIIALIGALISLTSSEDGTGMQGVMYVIFALSLVHTIGLIWTGITSSVRRLHDVGRSGWWMLISVFPLVGNLVLLVMLLWKGDPDANEFGEPTK